MKIDTNPKREEISRIPEQLIAAIYFLPILNYYIAELRYSYGLVTFSTYVYTAVYLLSAFSYFYVFLKFNNKAIMSLFFVFIIYLITILWSNKIWNVVFNTALMTSNFAIFWGRCFPLLLLCTFNLDLEYLMMLFYRYSLGVVALYVSSFVLNVFILGIGLHDYMSFAYTGLSAMFVCFHLSKVNKHKALPIVLAIAGCIVTVMGGSRGALGTLILFCVLYFIPSHDKKDGIKTWLPRITGTLMIILIYAFFNSIITFMEKFLKSHGYGSRILEFINGGFYGETLFQSSGREKVHNLVFEKIELWGHGIYSDRLVVGSYAHNWILELVYHFGIILGVALAGLIIYRAIAALLYARRSHDINAYFIAAVTLAMLFGKYFLSASYLTSSDFWVLVGLVFYIYSMKLKQHRFIIQKK